MRVASLPVERFAVLDGVEDAHGNPVDGFADPVVVLCFEFDPGGSNESLAAGHSDRVVTEPRLYAPFDAPFVASDEVVVPGHGRFSVDGVPARWENRGAGARPGCVVQLRRVDG